MPVREGAFYAAIDSFDYETISALMMMKMELMRKCNFQRSEIDLVLLGRLVNPEIRNAAQKRDVMVLQGFWIRWHVKRTRGSRTTPPMRTTLL